MASYGRLQYRPYTQPGNRVAPQRPRDPLALLAHTAAASGGFHGGPSILSTMPIGPGDAQGPHPPYAQPPATPPPDTTSSNGNGSSGSGGAGGAGNYENDPILQKIKALNASNVTSAEAEATAARKRLAVQLGDASLAKTLGLGDAIANAAQNNPFSILAGLLNNHVARAQGLDEQLNRGNLFYSSTRDTQLGNEGRQFLGEKSSAYSGAQNTLAQIAAQLLAAKQAAEASNLSAEGDAYGRGLQSPPDVVPPGVDPVTYQNGLAAYAALQQLLSNDPSVRSQTDTSLLSPSTVLWALGG